MNQESFSKQAKEVIHQYRNRMNHAESTEDVKKFFAYSAHELMGKAFDGSVQVEQDDIQLEPQSSKMYTISDRLLAQDDFKTRLDNSDLSAILGRMAEAASHRHTHLAKNPEKTEAKMHRH